MLTLGASFKTLADILINADYRRFFDHSENNRVNLGLGYMF